MGTCCSARPGPKPDGIFCDETPESPIKPQRLALPKALIRRPNPAAVDNARPPAPRGYNASELSNVTEVQVAWGEGIEQVMMKRADGTCEFIGQAGYEVQQVDSLILESTERLVRIDLESGSTKQLSAGSVANAIKFTTDRNNQLESRGTQARVRYNTCFVVPQGQHIMGFITGGDKSACGEIVAVIDSDGARVERAGIGFTMHKSIEAGPWAQWPISRSRDVSPERSRSPKGSSPKGTPSASTSPQQ